MKPFAKVTSQMPRSGIREIMDLAWKKEKEGPVIHLEVGQPDFDTPEHIRKATCDYVMAGNTKYIPNAGLSPLRAAVARRFESRTGVATTPDHILVTTGAVASVVSSFFTILESGDEVLLPDPSWPNYRMGVALAHGVSVFYALDPARGFLPDLREIESLITKRTKMLVLCSPSNPTGQVYGRKMMGDLMKLARKHDLYVLSDEVYEDIVFSGEHVSALNFDTDERTLIISGVSKGYAMTGYRVGFTRAKPDYIRIAAKIQEPLVSCGTGFSQLASVSALEGPQDCVRTMRDAYKRRCELAIAILRERGLYSYTPGGAFYLLIDISATGMGSRDFAVRLLDEKGVALAPGEAFGNVARNHVRISFASSEDNIREGLTRLCDMIGAYASKRSGSRGAGKERMKK